MRPLAAPVEAILLKRLSTPCSRPRALGRRWHGVEKTGIDTPITVFYLKHYERLAQEGPPPAEY